MLVAVTNSESKPELEPTFTIEEFRMAHAIKKVLSPALYPLKCAPEIHEKNISFNDVDGVIMTSVDYLRAARAAIEAKDTPDELADSSYKSSKEYWASKLV